MEEGRLAGRESRDKVGGQSVFGPGWLERSKKGWPKGSHWGRWPFRRRGCTNRASGTGRVGNQPEDHIENGNLPFRWLRIDLPQSTRRQQPSTIRHATLSPFPTISSSSSFSSYSSSSFSFFVLSFVFLSIFQNIVFSPVCDGAPSGSL